jgi:hypothetical protein
LHKYGVLSWVRRVPPGGPTRSPAGNERDPVRRAVAGPCSALQHTLGKFAQAETGIKGRKRLPRAGRGIEVIRKQVEAGRRAREGAVASAREELEETWKVLSRVAQAHPEWKSDLEVRLQRIDDDLRLLDRKQAAARPGPKDSGPDANAKWAPEDEYLKAYISSNKAERLERVGDTAAAIEELLKARQIVDAIVRKFPSWHPEVVNFRLKIIKAALERLDGGDDLSRSGSDKAISR